MIDGIKPCSESTWGMGVSSLSSGRIANWVTGEPVYSIGGPVPREDESDLVILIPQAGGPHLRIRIGNVIPRGFRGVFLELLPDRVEINRDVFQVEAKIRHLLAEC